MAGIISLLSSQPAGDNDLGVTTEIFENFYNKGITATAPSTPRGVCFRMVDEREQKRRFAFL
jgi:hypothetical protein